MKKEYIIPATTVVSNHPLEAFMIDQSIPTGGGDDRVDPEEGLAKEPGLWEW